MKNNIIETLKKELRAIIRDRKSCLMMLITPLMIPLLIVLFSFIYDDLMKEEVDVSYTIGVNYSLTEIEKQIVNELNLDTHKYNNSQELEEAYNNSEIDAYIVLDNNIYNIYSNSMINDSYNAAYIASLYLDNYNDYIAENYLNSIDANKELIYSNINYQWNEIAGNNDIVNYIINFAFIIAIMSITLTAIYCSTDSTAGEKERGTLETFLTFPIKSEELVIGKYLAISISCVITSIISAFLSILTLSICHEYFNIYKEVIFNFNFSSISLVLLIMLSYSLFISGLSIAIASFSRSYKEAQSSLTPLSLLTIVPMLFNLLNIDLNPVLSLIPIVNHTLLINDIFIGNINYMYIAIMFISTIAYVTFIVFYIRKQYKSEKILFS